MEIFRGGTKMKKLFVSLAAVTTLFCSTMTSANAKEELAPAVSANSLQDVAKVKVEQVDKYTTETTYANGVKQVVGINFDNATFYDENGNKLNYNPEQTSKNYVYTKGISGGKKTSGSGYSCVKGATVSNKIVGMYTLEFKADYCNNKNEYDTLNKVYYTFADAGSSASILKDGVMRKKENIEESAYGGIKAMVKASENSKMTTVYLYLRVGKDRAWTSTNF